MFGYWLYVGHLELAVYGLGRRNHDIQALLSSQGIKPEKKKPLTSRVSLGSPEEWGLPGGQVSRSSRCSGIETG